MVIPTLSELEGEESAFAVALTTVAVHGVTGYAATTSGAQRRQRLA
jgi:hypothetical protein